MPQAVENVFGVELDGCVVVLDFVFAEAFEVDAGGDLLKGFDEVDDREVFEVEFARLRHQGFLESIALDAGPRGRGAAFPLFAAGFEGIGGIAELFVLQELPDELSAGVGIILARLPGFTLAFWRGSEHARLDLHERGGGQEKLAGELDVDAVDLREIGHVLVGEGGDGDVCDVDLGAADQIEQEIQGPFEGVEMDAVFGVHGQLLGEGERSGAVGRGGWDCCGADCRPHSGRGEPVAQAKAWYGVYPYAMPDRPADFRKKELDFARGVLRAEADAVAATAGALGEDFHRAVSLLEACIEAGGTVLVTGLGKSGLIGGKISATMASLGIPSHSVHPSEAAHGDLGRFRPCDTVIALSFSGETEEVVNLAALLKQDGLPIIAIMRRNADAPSSLERLATVALPILVDFEAGGEGGLEFAAPTCSTTATLALGDALALSVARRREFSDADFAKRHPGGALGGLLRPVTECLRFVAGKNLPLIPESCSVREALERAAEIGRRPGAILLIDGGGKLTGIFTDGDLRRLILRDARELARPVREVMTTSPTTLPHTARMKDAVRMIRECRQDEIPVVDDDHRPVGILDVQDLVAMKLVRE